MTQKGQLYFHSFHLSVSYGISLILRLVHFNHKMVQRERERGNGIIIIYYFSSTDGSNLD